MNTSPTRFKRRISNAATIIYDLVEGAGWPETRHTAGRLPTAIRNRQSARSKT